MPKKPIDYSKTIMYKLVCDDLDVTYTYAGHTTNFAKRKNSHKSDCHNENSSKYNLKVYQIIRENGGFNNWKMLEIEKFKCNDLNEATTRERYWYEILNANMNSHNPNRSPKEWGKEYYENHKKIIYEKQKEYRGKHKESMLEYNKEYYQKNKEKLQQKIDCECSGKYTKQSLSKHIKTIKHQNFINNI